MRTPSKLLAFAAAIVALLLTASAAGAHGKSGDHGWPGHHGRGHVKTVSAAFALPLVTQGNLFEIATGQLAQTQAASPAVRSLGAMLVTDHTRLQDQVAALAGTLGVTLPTTLDPRAQRVVDKLRALSGDDFDEAWVKVELAAHKKALGLALATAIRGETPELRALTQGSLPVITSHIAALLDIASATSGDDDHGDDDGHHGDKGRHRGHAHHDRGHHRRSHAARR